MRLASIAARMFVSLRPVTATKAPIKDLGLPEDAIIGGIVRGDKVFIAVDDTQISAYDRVVLFAMPASVGKVGYYFN